MNIGFSSHSLIPDIQVAYTPLNEPLAPKLQQDSPKVDDQLDFNFPTIVIWNQPGCYQAFLREPDRIRHERSVHRINQRSFFCHVNGCPKITGTPCTCSDKFKEHLWKKHANFGYRKRTWEAILDNNNLQKRWATSKYRERIWKDLFGICMIAGWISFFLLFYLGVVMLRGSMFCWVDLVLLKLVGTLIGCCCFMMND